MNCIQIINYGLGNLGSVHNMLKRLNVQSRIVTKPGDLVDDKIILPGVGSFDSGITHLRDNGWLETLNEKALEKKIPVLGICLGMQLMCNNSEEGILPGLGWIDGSVIRFTGDGVRIPHMGWNVVRSIDGGKPSILHNPNAEELRFYFVHSYFVKVRNPSDILGTTVYHQEFTSAFHHENLYGVQFHPEKSHKFGMSLLHNFASL